ncbi:MAG: tetratricopeptide repeat protein, partial [Endomicrobiia bacterium]
YYPSFIVKMNGWFRNKIFNDAFVLMERKKIGLICVVVSLIVFYFGVFVPKISVSFKRQNVQDDLYHVWCYYYQGNYDKAEKICREILLIDPENLTAKEQLGLVYFAKGDYKKSMYYCKKVLEENANNRRIQKIVEFLNKKGFKK